MLEVILKLIISVLETSTIHDLIIGLLEHLAGSATHPLEVAGVKTIEDVMNGKVDVTAPTSVAAAVQDAVNVGTDAVANVAAAEGFPGSTDHSK